MNNDYLTITIENFRRVTNEMLEALGQEPLPTRQQEIQLGTIVFAWNEDRPARPIIGYYKSFDGVRAHPHIIILHSQNGGDEDLFEHVAPVTLGDLA